MQLSDNRFVVDTSKTENELSTMIAPYRDSMQDYMGAVIGFSDSAIEKYGPESPLGNLIADMIFEAGMDLPGLIPGNDIRTNNTFCLINFGGLRSEINRGEITVGEIYELMPFDNALTILRISADSIGAIFDYLRGCEGQPVSNAEFTIGKDAATLKIGGDDASGLTEIFIITSDYLADGGDEMQFLGNPLQRWDSGALIRDVIMNYIRKTQHLKPPAISGRMIISEE
jgi:2',3'-cyclic-nucleotide 2'-phosphodiesterase (5'-nucleotidase family)